MEAALARREPKPPALADPNYKIVPAGDAGLYDDLPVAR